MGIITCLRVGTWAPEQTDFCTESERDPVEAVWLHSHIWAFLRDFPFPSPDCACLCKACLKSLIILYKPKDQGSVLRVSSWAHHFMWGISGSRWQTSVKSANWLSSACFCVFHLQMSVCRSPIKPKPRCTGRLTRINDLGTGWIAPLNARCHVQSNLRIFWHLG